MDKQTQVDGAVGSDGGGSRSVDQGDGKCACPSVDARTCYDLRNYGRSPVRRGATAWVDPMDYVEGTVPDFADDGVCECSCHDEFDDGRDDY